VDYKTGKAKEKLDFKEKEQLLLYQMAAEDSMDRQVSSLSFYYVKENKEFEFLGSEKEIEKAKEKFSERIRAIKERKFSPKPGFLCKYCDYKDICEHRKI
jgi:CRISPR/Cas system-associated exonuclease Cas4 (RecB family)